MAPSSKFILAFLLATLFSNINIRMAAGIDYNAAGDMDGAGAGGSAQVGQITPENRPGSNGGVGGQVGGSPLRLPRKVGGSGCTGGQVGVSHLENIPGEVEDVAITGGVGSQGGVSQSGIPSEGGATVTGCSCVQDGEIVGANGCTNGGTGATGIGSVP